MIKSPLRYPGGKSKAIKVLNEYFPKEIDEIREPFAGGASVGLFLKQKHPTAQLWLNDLYFNLYNFWLKARDSQGWMTKKLLVGLKQTNGDESALRALFEASKMGLALPSSSSMEKAVYFFFLNRCSYAGLTEAGGFSKTAALTRFTKSSIDKLALLEPILRGSQITNLDYSVLLQEVPLGKNPFIFLDPPYDQLKTGKDGIYGKDGIVHAEFDHERFYEEVSSCPLKWMITYNDAPEMRERWKKFNIREFSLSYSFHRTKTDSRETKREKTEVLITNY